MTLELYRLCTIHCIFLIYRLTDRSLRTLFFGTKMLHRYNNGRLPAARYGYQKITTTEFSQLSKDTTQLQSDMLLQIYMWFDAAHRYGT